MKGSGSFATMTVCGTVKFMAPELLHAAVHSNVEEQNKQTTRNAIKVDSWSMGVVVLDCLQKTLKDVTFSGTPDDDVTKFRRVAKDEDKGVILDKVVIPLLVKEPNDRPYFHKLDIAGLPK